MLIRARFPPLLSQTRGGRFVVLFTLRKCKSRGKVFEFLMSQQKEGLSSFSKRSSTFFSFLMGKRDPSANLLTPPPSLLTKQGKSTKRYGVSFQFQLDLSRGNISALSKIIHVKVKYGVLTFWLKCLGVTNGGEAYSAGMVSASSGLLPLGGVGNENFSNVKRVIFVRDSRDIVIVKQKMRSN